MRTYSVTHRTTYTYSDSVTACHNEARLRPRETPFQHALSHQLSIQPSPRTQVERLDYFGNPTTYFTVEDPHTVLDVVAESVVEVADAIPVPLLPTTAWETVRDWIRSSGDESALDARSMTIRSPLVVAVPAIVEFAQESFRPGRDLLESLRDLNLRLFEEFSFDPAATTIATPIAEVFEQKRGVCQDFAHLAIGLLRSVGLPARYVSGYIETDPPAGSPRLVGADASHAWVETFVPGYGWLDFDPTNNLLPADRHIVLGWGRDYGDVTPLKGVITGGGAHALDVAVDVIPTTSQPAASSSQMGV